MVLKTVWMFVDVANGRASHDCIADTRAALIEKAKKMYNKTDAEIRGWAKQGSEPGLVEFRLVTGHRKIKKVKPLGKNTKLTSAVRRTLASAEYQLRNAPNRVKQLHKQLSNAK